MIDKHLQKLHTSWEYGIKQRKFMIQNRVCIFCLFFFKIIHPPQIVHHSRGRKYFLLDETTYIAVCKFADKTIHDLKNKTVMEETGFYYIEN